MPPENENVNIVLEITGKCYGKCVIVENGTPLPVTNLTRYSNAVGYGVILKTD
jgi:hypothetical protein